LKKNTKYNIKLEIIELFKKGFTSKQTVCELNRSGDMSPLIRSIKSQYIKESICEIINKEKLRDCFTDAQILSQLDFPMSRRTLSRYRFMLKIPPAEKNYSELHRRYLYFKTGEGRIKWSPDCNHTYIKSGRRLRPYYVNRFEFEKNLNQ